MFILQMNEYYFNLAQIQRFPRILIILYNITTGVSSIRRRHIRREPKHQRALHDTSASSQWPQSKPPRHVRGQVQALQGSQIRD